MRCGGSLCRGSNPPLPPLPNKHKHTHTHTPKPPPSAQPPTDPHLWIPSGRRCDAAAPDALGLASSQMHSKSTPLPLRSPARLPPSSSSSSSCVFVCLFTPKGTEPNSISERAASRMARRRRRWRRYVASRCASISSAATSTVHLHSLNEDTGCSRVFTLVASVV